MTESISRGRRLTADEVAKFKQMRQQAEAEKAEVMMRLKNEPAGPGSWGDLHELRALVDSLRAERERRGLSREEAAGRAGIEPRRIEDLEEHRDLNPSLSTLSRLAAAVGRHLMMGLAAGQPVRQGVPIAPIQAQSAASETATK